MRITSKGQVTIPQEIREQLGLLPNTEVAFVVEDGTVRIVKIEPTSDDSRGQRALQRLRGSATVRLTTEQIMAHTRGSK